MCFECVNTFIDKPMNLSIVLFSAVMAISLIVLFITRKKYLSNKTKIGTLYGVVFFLAFPIVYYNYARTCQSAFYSCNLTQSILYSSFTAIIVSLAISFVMIPIIYMVSSRSFLLDRKHTIYLRVQEYAAKLGVKMPRTYIIDRAEPSAFSFSHILPSIFVTVGLIEILSPKETDAVLLHELGHIKNKPSFLKFTNNIFRHAFPIRNFNIFKEELSKEERDADNIAIGVQGTSKYLDSAKSKIQEYHAEEKSTLAAL
jgi:Zn-dependent protease with chaperone function